MNLYIILVVFVALVVVSNYQVEGQIKNILTLSKEAREALIKAEEARKIEEARKTEEARKRKGRSLSDLDFDIGENLEDGAELEDVGHRRLKRGKPHVNGTAIRRLKRGKPDVKKDAAKVWDVAKCRTAYYLIRPKQCSKYDLF